MLCVAGALSLGCLATTYYVKPDGSDSATGKSWETAFATPNKGFNIVHNKSANHEVVIAAGTYQLTDACRCAGPTQDTGKRVVIRGETGNPEDVVLMGNDTFEIVRLSRCVTVSGLTISHGSNSNRTNRAAGVRVGANDAGLSIVSNCIITACYNAYTNHTLGTDKKDMFGGPVYVYNNGLLVDCVVSNNSSIFYGCGVTLDGENATALRCRIEGNVATNTDNSGVSVFGVTGDTTKGGRLIDCVVQSNHTAYCSGARNVLWVEGCTFRANSLDPNMPNAHSSSAIAIGATGVVVTNCTFVDNRAGRGYATVYVTQPNVHVLDSRFTGNSVSQYGGAICFSIGSPSVFSSASNCLFVSNSVAMSSGKGGGAIRIDAGRVALANCTFNGNTASRGGAVDIVGSSANSTIVSCTNCVFTGNQVQTYGGAVRTSYAAQVCFDDCRFVSNSNLVSSTEACGGAISVNQARDGGRCTVQNSTLADNTSLTYGGAIDAVTEVNGDGAHLVCSNCVFSGNMAANTGGGVRMTKYTRAIFDDCRFVSNATTVQKNHENYGGGGIFLYEQQNEGVCAISNSVFAGNVSSGRGGAVASTWNGICFCEIANCVFTNNTSYFQGGAVSFRERTVNGRPFSIRNSLFAFNCTACATGNDSSGGGLLLVTSNDVEIANCTIVSNTSAYTAGQSGGVHQRWGGRYVNCIIANNLTKSGTSQDSNWTDAQGSFVNCCAWPNTTTHMTAENGCVNADPLFADAANGDFTLQPNSPCRNAGVLEDWMADATDLAGSPRVSGKGVDMGCYELFVPSGLNIIIR